MYLHKIAIVMLIFKLQTGDKTPLLEQLHKPSNLENLYCNLIQATLSSNYKLAALLDGILEQKICMLHATHSNVQSMYCN